MFGQRGAKVITRIWPTGSLHWADTPEVRNPCTKPGQAPGFVLPAVWLALVSVWSTLPVASRYGRRCTRRARCRSGRRVNLKWDNLSHFKMERRKDRTADRARILKTSPPALPIAIRQSCRIGPRIRARALQTPRRYAAAMVACPSRDCPYRIPATPARLP